VDDLARMNPRRRAPTFRKILFLSLLAIAALAIIYSAIHSSSRDWLVPEEAKQLKNPIQPAPAVLKDARAVYDDKCANCHGSAGRGDGADARRYDPAPTNFTDEIKMNAATDGELFYKISEGRKPMPVFKTKLTDYQRWELVLLIRSFTRTEQHPRSPDR
jgi:mono/diheme cytochrome c family protein